MLQLGGDAGRAHVPAVRSAALVFFPQTSRSQRVPFCVDRLTIVQGQAAKVTRVSPHCIGFSAGRADPGSLRRMGRELFLCPVLGDLSVSGGALRGKAEVCMRRKSLAPA